MLLNNKRKFIVGGVVALTSVALITTGFATWAIAQDTSASSVATPDVVVVEGSTNLTISFLTEDVSYDDDLKFGPKDDGGSVASTETGGEEDLSITLVGTVEDYHVCESLDFAVDVYDRGTSLSTPSTTNVSAAATYYTLPAEQKIDNVSSATGNVTTGDGVYTITNNVATWHKTLIFGWGSAFNIEGDNPDAGNVNPSLFYEGDRFIGKDAVKTALENMNTALGNIEFLVTVTAKVVTSVDE
jgi:hypothetical protein